MKLDIQKQIEYWRNGAEEDWDVGAGLLEAGKVRHGLFFIHLALEKILKAHVCRTSGDFAPRIHSLLRLSESSSLDVSEKHQDFLARFDQYNVAGRYPGTLDPLPAEEERRADMRMAGEVYSWLMEIL